ncbi:MULTISPECIES: polysaccharide biosynthesis/export family protein [unclassified Ruegeria]|uniref:polysaccharide biosynthesis/export family protein n=1 Tax=unclassified Ruegeria TaxID=2625375 RepID=UPI0014910C91|nr:MULTISPECIES: polysaccharide biosynthesis/export family protein [unclassified Ruegeria]NOD49775.1 polysaccharide export protein [Ruegeria sp. HKCCD5849]NOD54123.1 polysaccharide export protein [Ruegeria sp. HKCCD5851]NOD70106.1 polysaccharide export protein [Ruegeria sp. HKCCD7303]
MRTVIGPLIAFIIAMIVATGAWAQSSYQIKPGDALQVEVLEDPTLNRTVLVLPDGSINFPLAGSLRAAGRSTNGLSSSLASALSSNFNTPPTVFISVASLAPPPLQGGLAATGPTIDIFIMGEVNIPGKFLATEGTTILQVLAQAGGLTNFAARKRIELRRADSKTGVVNKYIYNYNGSGGGIQGNTVLRTGDVVVVPSRRLFE